MMPLCNQNNDNNNSKNEYCVSYLVKQLKRKDHKVEELQKIRKMIYASWFKKRLSPDEQVLAYRQYNLTRDLVNVLSERIEVFRKENPKPRK